MAKNKYCNLDGTKKIKDEFSKISSGFTKVEDDIKDIIVTPAEGISEQEIIQARKGKSTLGTKIDDIDENILNANNNVSVLGGQLNARIDNIIATPTTVSQQEIIDARQSKASLGANLTAIKDEVTAHKEDYTKQKDNIYNQLFPIKNIILNGNFSKQFDGWTKNQATTIQFIESGISFVSSAQYAGVDHPLLGDVSIGDNIYMSADVKSTSNLASIRISYKSGYNVGITESNGSGVFETLSFIGIIPSDTDFSFLRFRCVDSRATLRDAIGLKNVLGINLTKTFGVGKEPSKEDMDLFISQLPKKWFDDVTSFKNIKELYEKYQDLDNEVQVIKNTNSNSFLVPTKNLFDKSVVTIGHYVDKSTGQLISQANNYTSDYIPVLPNTSYSTAYDTFSRIAYYNIHKNFISGTDLVSPILTPVDAYFVRFSFFKDIDINVLQFELGAENTDYEPYGNYLSDNNAINIYRKDELYNKIELDGILDIKKLYVKYTDNRFEFLMKSGEQNKYFKVNFIKVDIPFTNGGTYQNSNLWRLEKGFFGILDGTNFIQEDEFLNGGAWECAISIDGLPDFHGTFHGYELMDNITFFVNGIKTDFNVDIFTGCEEFEIIYKARLIKQGTSSEAIANVVRHYIINKDGIKLKQKYKWLQSLKINKAYLTMLCSKRFSIKGNNTSKQITDTIITDYDYETYNISADGHSTPITYDVNRVHFAKIWGNNSKYYADVIVEYDNKDEVNRFNVSNAPDYNKLYFSYADGKTVAINDEWLVNTHYNFKS